VKDKFMRLQADFDNFRKRTAAEKDSLRSAVRGDTVAELLPLVSGRVDRALRKRGGETRSSSCRVVVEVPT
jgi:molecular chaperone GrpE (heat shock protein)